MSFTWTPDLAVGVERIDEQHRELFRRVAALAVASRAGAGAAAAYGTLAFLGDYVVAHFADEEALMREVGYPDLAAHATEHAGFLATFQHLRLAFARGGADGELAAEVERELCAWIRQHVTGSDRCIGEHVRARAREGAGQALRDAPESSPRSASAGSPPDQA
jgi:hemerythrin